MSLFWPDRRRQITEAHPGGAVAGAAWELSGEDAGFRLAGTPVRNLFDQVLRYAQNWSVHLYRSNPLANRIIRVYTSYCAGEGFRPWAANPDVQATIDEAWTAWRNQLHRNHRGYARDWLLFGEAAHPLRYDEAGHTTVGFADPNTIDRVDRHPENNMVLTTLWVKPAGGSDPEPLSIVRPSLSLDRDGFGLLDGDALYWPYERIGASTRGFPLLLPTLDWIDGTDQNLWELLERQKAMRAFYWDVEVDGDATTVRDAQTLFGTAPPRSGSVRFHTANMRVQAISPQIAGGEDVRAATFLLRHVATGAGLAPHWLSEPEDANRSTAQQMDKPVLRSLTDVQAEWRLNMIDLLTFIVHRKVAAGRLPAVLPEHAADGRPLTDGDGQPTMRPAAELVRLDVPEIDSDDVQQSTAALGNLVNALVAAVAADLVNPEAARAAIRGMLPALGVQPEELPDVGDGEEAGAVDAALGEALDRLGL